MSTENDIYNFVVEYLERSSPVPGDTVEAIKAYRYLDAGHINSFALFPFIMELEDQFGVSFSAEDTQSDEFRTVGGVVGMVVDKVRAA